MITLYHNTKNSIVQLDDGADLSGYEEYSQTPVSIAPSEIDVRKIRDNMLTTIVDPIVCNPLRWTDLTTAEQNAWLQYRTDLLNITDQAGFPHNVTWPTIPE